MTCETLPLPDGVTVVGGHVIRHGQPLSTSELEITGLLADGLSNEEIARALWISGEAVKSRVRKLLWKLEARNRTHAAAILVRRGIVT